jgi:hypothetical protein
MALTRMQLLLPRREEWELHRDPKKDNILFCPTDQPPNTGSRITVDVLFNDGPRFVVRGRVVWRRPATDRRVRAGVGVEVDRSYEAALRFLHSWSTGEMPERRVHPRLPIRLRVAYGVQGQRRINFTRDVSAGGVYIHSAQLLGRNEPIQVSLAPPSGSASVPLMGRVTRCDELDQTPGMAICLDFNDPASQRRFAEFVAELWRQMERGELPEQYLSPG